MENEFKNIDDLFKDLKHSEQQETSASWQQMKDLLDLKMPVGYSKAFSFKRYFIPMLALLLLGSATLYYFNINNDFSFINPIPSSNNSTKITENKAISAKATLAEATNKNKDKQSERVLNHLLAINNNHNKILASTEKSLPSQHATDLINDNSPNKSNPNLSENPKQKTKRPTKATTKVNNNRNSLNSISIASAADLKSSVAPEASKIKPVNTTSIVPVSGAAINNNHNKSISKTITKENIIERFDPKTGRGISTSLNSQSKPELNSKDNQESEDKLWIPVAKEQVATIVRNSNNQQLYKKEKDTIKRYLINKMQIIDTRNLTLKRIEVDTVSIMKVERIEYAPLDFAATHKIMLASTKENNTPADIVTTENNQLVPLANYKINSKIIKPNAIDRFKNTTSGLTSVFNGTTNWYAAFFIGGNASFGNPAAFGLQAGVALFYSFVERWSVAVGFNFMNKYFPSYHFADQQTKYNVNRTLVPGGWHYSGTAVSSTNNYSVGNINTLNLPIYINYSLTDRLSVFGGLNISYALPLKWTKENSISLLTIQQTENGNNNPFQNTTFKIDEQNDFDARLGIGYIGGLSYNLSRRVSLDARVQQNLWQNSSKNLQGINQMFEKPTFELSFSYYFGRRERVIYILDSRRQNR